MRSRGRARWRLQPPIGRSARHPTTQPGVQTVQTVQNLDAVAAGSPYPPAVVPPLPEPADVEHLVRGAVSARAELDCDAVRLVDGAGDGLPQLAVERFGEAFRVRGHPDRAPWLPGVRAGLDDPAELFWRFGHADEGGPDDGAREIVEAGLRFGVHLRGHHNPGLFLDGRAARAWVRAHARGRRILNLFAYTCGFGVAAAAGGARATTNVDPVPGVLRRGQENYRRNDLASDGRSFWRTDALSALRRAHGQGGRFDGIVLDPPPVATGGRRGRRTDPVRDLPRLASACRDVLDPGGWLLVLSATPALSDAALLEAVGLGEPMWRGTSGADFRVEPKLRAWAFVQPPR